MKYTIQPLLPCIIWGAQYSNKPIIPVIPLLILKLILRACLYVTREAGLSPKCISTSLWLTANDVWELSFWTSPSSFKVGLFFSHKALRTGLILLVMNLVLLALIFLVWEDCCFNNVVISSVLILQIFKKKPFCHSLLQAVLCCINQQFCLRVI